MCVGGIWSGSFVAMGQNLCYFHFVKLLRKKEQGKVLNPHDIEKFGMPSFI